jgi:hypothetical protein
MSSTHSDSKHRVYKTVAGITNQRNFLLREDWLRLPEDIRRKLIISTSPKTGKINLGEVTIDTGTSNSNEGTIVNTVGIHTEHVSDTDTSIIEYLSNETQTPPKIPTTVLNTNRTHPMPHAGNRNNNQDQNDTITINGKLYWQVKIIDIMYRINTGQSTYNGYALIDRGANGGVLGSDVKILNHTGRTITLTGLDNHQVKVLRICTGTTLSITHKDPAIFIMHQYAYLGHGKTIHAAGQLEAFSL